MNARQPADRPPRENEDARVAAGIGTARADHYTGKSTPDDRNQQGAKKPYTIQYGIQLDADLRTHAQRCASCAGYDGTRPVSAGALCIEGAALLKRAAAAVAPKRGRPARDPHYATRAEIKTLYK